MIPLLLSQQVAHTITKHVLVLQFKDIFAIFNLLNTKDVVVIINSFIKHLQDSEKTILYSAI
jgi:hypothetical protein